MKLAVVGAGRVGLVSGLVLAESGHEVTFVDVDAERVASLADGHVPFFEPGLEDLLSAARVHGRVRFTTDPAGVSSCRAAFLCVPTPGRDDGWLDTRALEAAADALRLALDRDASELDVVFVRSTSVPGTSRRCVHDRLRASGRALPHVGVLPEFFREGSAVSDARAPDRIVVGAADAEVFALARAIFAGTTTRFVETTRETAELVKLTNNAWLSTCISFANEVARVAESVPDVDALAVMEGVHRDRRFGEPEPSGLVRYLLPGVGFGGSCLGKDLRALTTFAREAGVAAAQLEQTLHVNETQPARFVARLVEALGSLDGARVLVLGVTFKPDTDDLRDSVAFPVVRALARGGAQVVVHDPVAATRFVAAHLAREPASSVRAVDDWREEVLHVDAVVLITAWPDYAARTAEALAVRGKPIVVADGRGVLRACAALPAVTYVGVGLGTKRAEVRDG